MPCAAAEITVKGNKVYVLGTVETGDDQKFENAVKPYDGPMQVILHSAGGRLRPALNIGSLIRERRWTTHVEYTCKSACPMIWLGGIKHTKTQAAQIGFHSAGDVHTGGMSPAGNALILSFLTDLGYSEAVGRYVTGSKTITYLTRDEAKRLGIQMEIVAPTIPWRTFANVNLRKAPDPLPSP